MILLYAAEVFQAPRIKLHHMLRRGHASVHFECQQLSACACLHSFSISSLCDSESLYNHFISCSMQKMMLSPFMGFMQWTLYAFQLHKQHFLPNHWIIPSHVNYSGFLKNILYFYPWVMHPHCLTLLIHFIIIVLSDMNSVMCASMWLMDGPEIIIVYLRMVIL